MLEFAAPWLFLLLPLPLLVRWLAPPHRESQDALQVPFFARLVDLSGLTPRVGASVRRRRRIQALASILGWCLLVTASADPQWIGPPAELRKHARDLMLAVDLSGSMDARDFPGVDGGVTDRLEAAKAVLRDFASRREGDRLGLIVFGNAAYLQAPFTDDLETWLQLLDESEVGMAGPSTALGDAIGLALSLFIQSETQQRVLVLLTDGNDTGSRVPPVDAAAIAATEGVTIYTVAIGDPQTVGEEALDLATLDAISTATDGKSFVALDGASLESAYADIDRLEPATYESLSWRPRRSLFHIPLAAFALLYLLALPLFAYLGPRAEPGKP